MAKSWLVIFTVCLDKMNRRRFRSLCCVILLLRFRTSKRISKPSESAAFVIVFSWADKLVGKQSQLPEPFNMIQIPVIGRGGCSHGFELAISGPRL
jgi:hypothetical protein